MKLSLVHHMAALCGLALGACTSSAAQPSKVGAQPSWRESGSSQSHDAPASPTPKAREPIVFAPAGPAATSYNDPPIEPAPSWPLADAIRGSIEAYCKESGIQAPRADGRLYKAAAELAKVLPEDAPIAYPAIEFALQRHGIIEPSPHLVPVAGSLDDPQSMLEELGTRLPAILSNEKVARFGIGAVRGDGPGRDVLVILLQASFVTTKPIRREIAAGGVVRIEGEALGDYREPDVFVTREDGTVVRQKLKRLGRKGFRAELSCKARQGRQQIEITAMNDAGSTVLANFPVWCNDKAPGSVTVKPSVDEMPIATEGEAEARMLMLVNRDRQTYGLEPLSLSTELSAVARGHSVEMRDAGFVAHISPSTGSADDRVRKARIRTALVLENVARAYSVTEAQAGLMNSPGHRANLLSDKATHIGIGIAFQESEAEGRVMFITQLFMRVPPSITPDKAREHLLAAIAGAKPRIRHDAGLSSVAQAYANSVVATGWSESKAARWREQNFDPLRPRFARVGTAVVTVADLDSLDMDQAFREKWITHYGLGLVQGYHEEFGEGAIFIVLLVAQTR